MQIANRFPHETIPTLPTQFRNAIRSFEAYPAVAYGVDPIPAWPRLVGVITQEYASATADAKAEVDFFLNLFFLLLFIVAIAAGRFVYDVYRSLLRAPRERSDAKSFPGGLPAMPKTLS
jgi:hypothetical protein